MLIVGAKGFAKEVIEVILQANPYSELRMFDDLNADISGLLFGRYPIFKSLDEVVHYFESSNEFTIGVGNPIIRKRLFNKFTDLGGIYTSTISPKASVGMNDVLIGAGCNIMSGIVLCATIKAEAVTINKDIE